MMRRMTTVCVSLIVAMLIASGALAAQHQASGQMQMGGQGAQAPSPSSAPPMMGSGMMGMTCPMVPMMQQMMGGQMDPSSMGMMGMMSGGKMDPKTTGRMLQMRGDMLKAIGEVLLKHGKAMEQAK